MLNQSVANNFAEVLFKIKGYNIDEVYRDFLEFKNIEKNEPLFSEMLKQDFLSSDKKKILFYNKFTNLSKYNSFFDYIFKTKKSIYISSIIDNFIKLYRDKNKIGVIEVVSSVEIDPENLTKIVNNIKAKFNFKEIIVNNKINSNIIAGFVVYVNNNILDFSINGILNNFKHLFKK